MCLKGVCQQITTANIGLQFVKDWTSSLVWKINSKLMKNTKVSLLTFFFFLLLGPSLCTFKMLEVFYKIIDSLSVQTYVKML